MLDDNELPTVLSIHPMMSYQHNTERMTWQAGAVIGRQGATIEGLRMESKAEIKVSPDLAELAGGLPAGISGDDEFVTVEGSPASVLSALESIALKLMGYQVRKLVALQGDAYAIRDMSRDLENPWQRHILRCGYAILEG